MRIKTQQGISLGVVSLILFFAGTGLCLLNHWKPDQPFLSLPNLLAVAMAAFLTTAEYSFLWCDFRLIQARKPIKKIALACCLVCLIGSMSWAIGTEWESAEKKLRSALGMASVEQISKTAIESAKSRGERSAAAKTATGAVVEVTKNLTGSDTRAYQANFIVALLALVVAHFCVEPYRRRQTGRGNQLSVNPALADRIKAKIGFDAAEVKAYQVPGGYAIHSKKGYEGFVSDKDV